jgi:hypothetical protein
MLGRLSLSAIFLGIALALPLIWWLELAGDDHGAIALAIILCCGVSYGAIAVVRAMTRGR